MRLRLTITTIIIISNITAATAIPPYRNKSLLSIPAIIWFSAACSDIFTLIWYVAIPSLSDLTSIVIIFSPTFRSVFPTISTSAPSTFAIAFTFKLVTLVSVMSKVYS